MKEAFPENSHGVPRWATSRRHRASRFLTSVLLALSAAYLLFFDRFEVIEGQPRPREKPFSWQSVTPSRSLEFEECYGDVQCARLDVPLDWTEAPGSKKFESQRAAVAVVRLPAKVPPSDPRYGGAVLINPGGPGGSGVQFLDRKGRDIQTIVSTAESKPDGLYFDVIGFDPRGVNNTTPHVSCFPDDTSAEAWAREGRTWSFPYNNASFNKAWSRSAGLTKSCVWRYSSDDTPELGKYVSTPNVVQDMVAIIEALGEWREKEAVKLNVIDPATQERMRWKKGKEKLFYWGFSYGTVLGSTFATLHPDKVERVALDGVCDTDDYYAANWLANLQDTDSIIENFFKECHASPEHCALAADDATVDDIRKVYQSTIAGLLRDPLPVLAHDNSGPAIIEYSDLKSIIKDYVYSPYPNAVRLARIIDALAKGNGTELAKLKSQAFPSSCRSPLCIEQPWGPECYDPTAAFHSFGASIACTDGVDVSHRTREDNYINWKKLEDQSKTIGSFWTSITMACSNWALRPKWNFNGKIAAENTSHPILFLSNTRDPVTPARNAFKMSSRFPGSVVFGQNADGHCSQSQPSRCVSKGVRQYFQTGKLPDPGLSCEPDKRLFDEPEKLESLSDEDQELSAAAIRMAEQGREQDFLLGI